MRPLGIQLGSSRTTAILKADQLEVVHIVLGAGKQLREHSAPGEITVQCPNGALHAAHSKPAPYSKRVTSSA